MVLNTECLGIQGFFTCCLHRKTEDWEQRDQRTEGQNQPQTLQSKAGSVVSALADDKALRRWPRGLLQHVNGPCQKH